MPDVCFGVEAGKHDRTDLHAADAARAVEFDRQRLGGEFIIWDVWKDRARIDIHAVSACGLDRGNPRLAEPRREISGLSEAVGKKRFVEAFIQADRHRIEV